MKLKKILENKQLFLLLILILIWIVFGLVNPEILSVASVYALFRSSIVPLLIALPEMMIIIMGGIDMVFTIVVASSSYCSLLFWTKVSGVNAPFIGILLMSMMIGVLCYVICWFFIEKVKIPTFITTLGANSLIKGFVLAFVGTSYVNSLPNCIKSINSMNLATAKTFNGADSILHGSIIFVIIIYILMYIMMEKTVFGRKLYAIGANEDFARRAGINVSKVRLISFVIAGIICAWAGLLHDSLSRLSMPIPVDIVGKELNSIAAVVIGIGGSKKAGGAVVGTALGVLLLQLIMTNLVMLGVPSYWQQLVSGIIIMGGLSLQTINLNKKGNGGLIND